MANDIRIKIVVDNEGAVRSTGEFVDNATNQLKRLDAPSNTIATNLKRGVDSTVPSVERLGRTSGNARMAMMGMSQAFSDAPMFMNGFRSGMMSIGNNLDFVVQSLVHVKNESAATGVSMKSALLGAISGPAGIMVGVSLLIAGLQVLPSLFKETSEAASDAADEGLKKFGDTLGQIGLDNQIRTAEVFSQRLKAIGDEMKSIREKPTGGFRTSMQRIGGESIEVQTPILSKAQIDRLAALEEEGNIKQKLLDETNKAIAATKETVSIEKQIKESLVANGDEWQKNLFRIEQINEQLKRKTSEDGKALLTASQFSALSNEKQALETRNTELLKQAGLLEKEKLATASQLADQRMKELDLAKQHFALGDISVRQYEAILMTAYRTETAEENRLKIRREMLEIDQRMVKLQEEGLTKIEPGMMPRKDKPLPGVATPQAPSGGHVPGGSIAEQMMRVQVLEERLNEASTQSKREQIEEELKLEQKKLDAMTRSSDEQRKMWQQDHQVAMAFINATGAAVGQMLTGILGSHRQAKDEMDAVWLAFQNTAVNALADILQTEITNAIVSTATQQTATATKVALKQTEAAAAIEVATAESIAASGPFAIFTAGAIIAAGIAALFALRAAFGFRSGGELLPGEFGGNETNEPELIAPKRTFRQVIAQDILPAIIQTSRIVTIAEQRLQPALVGSAGGDTRLYNELRSLRREMKQKNFEFNGQFDGVKVVDKNLRPVQKRQAEVVK